MQWHGWRIPVVLIALLVGLGVFLGAQWLYNRYSYQQPLNDVLRHNPAVASFTINQQEAVLRVTVRLKRVDNLMDAYRKLRRDIAGVLGGRDFRLEIRDDPDDRLQEAYYYSQFALYEAVDRGDYRDCAASIDAYARRAGVKDKIFLDENNIYLQLQDNGHYLYRVIPRRPAAASAPPAGGTQ